MVLVRIVAVVVVALLARPPASLAAREVVIVHVHDPVALLTQPGGVALGTLGSRTQFGSPRVLSVLAHSGRWLEVATAGLPAGDDGWVNAGTGGLSYSTTPLSITIVLDTRTLELRRGGRTLRSFTVGVGAPSSPTPTGRFIVTDKLPGARYSAAYGCCILALSARQTRLPAGWKGGDLIAIHGTNEPSTIGEAESSGCIHAADAELRYLVATVPLGTPVTIVA